MQDLLAKSYRDFKEGSIVKGRVLEIRPREVLVDIGYKSEGVIPSHEFEDIESMEVGDEVEVLLERLENDEGMVVLSKEKAAYRQNWNKIAQVFAGARRLFARAVIRLCRSWKTRNCIAACGRLVA